jgi:hypothetical protein
MPEDEQNEFEMVSAVIKGCYLNGKLPELIGNALGKDGVVVALVDARGAILVLGDHRPDTVDAMKKGSMVRQMAALIDANMMEMGRKASNAETTCDGTMYIRPTIVKCSTERGCGLLGCPFVSESKLS